jgi:hypothetical protein
LQLLIDDGVPSRSSRGILMSPKWSISGISTCDHKTKSMMTSILYADSFKVNQYGQEQLDKHTIIGGGALSGRCTNLPETIVNQLDCEIFNEQNRLRTSPQSFINLLQKKLDEFDNVNL